MGKLNREKVITEAIAILDEAGADALTIPGLASRLKIRPPSLYNHIQSLSDMKREIAIFANRDLTKRLRTAIGNKSGKKAAKVLASCFRKFALDHPALYRYSVRMPPKNDREWVKAALDFRTVWMDVFEEGLSEINRIYATRIFRSALHGFIDLELEGGWREEVADLDDTYEEVIQTTLSGIDHLKN